MKLGILKNILLENKVTSILVYTNLYPKPLVVVDALFDQRTRKKFFLNADIKAPVRTNNIQTIKTYVLDFSDEHEVLVYNRNRNAVYFIQPTFEIDNTSGVLSIFISGM